jgi:hypothetical protein
MTKKKWTPTQLKDQSAWDLQLALSKLKISEVKFNNTCNCDTCRNIVGYARERRIAIRPSYKHKTAVAFHEMAHVLCGHCRSSYKRSLRNKFLMEIEATTIAGLCLIKLGHMGGLDLQAENCKLHIWPWLSIEGKLPDGFKEKVVRIAERIVKAGLVQ